MELSPSPAPLPRAYDDRAVLLLEPMRDWFYARGLKKPRFSKTQEEEWVAGVAKDIQRNEIATAVVKRWLKAISLTERRELHHVVPPLTDETLQLFVRFFWLVNSDNRPRANDLLLDARREWGREKYFHEYAANRFLEFGEDPALWITVVTDWVHEQRSKGHGLNLRKTAKSLKSLKSVKRKMNVNTPFSTKATKRLAAAPPNFKRKRRLETKARPGQRTTVNKDAESSEVASGLGRITRSSKRKCGHNVPKLGKLQSKRHIKCSVIASSVPSFPVGATGRGFKRTDVKTKNSARKQRLFARSSLSSSSTDRSQTPANTTTGEGNAGLNSNTPHIGASAYKFHVNGKEKDASLLYTFDNDGAEVAEDEDDLYGCAPNEYLGISSIELDQKQHVAVRPRPPLPVTPPIWAQSRQEVCESLDSFRSYQGGVYHTNDIVKGYLLGGHSSGRDLFHHGGRLIISHGGGKSEAIHAKNRRLEIQGPTDQLEDDRSVRALLNNYRSGRPLVVIADNNYALFPFDLSANGYAYAVLGLYWIAHAWAELQLVDKDHSVVRYKFAFQWCEGQGDPWWLRGTEEVPDVAQAPNGRPCDREPGANTTEERDNSTSSCQLAQPEITTYSCRSCQLSSPVVYQDAPMCLQPRCAAFCRIDQPMLDPPSRAQTLSYSTELLRLRPANHLPVCADSLYPPLPTEGSTTPRPFAKGMHCKDCGRLSTRFKWEHYECSHCHRIYEAPSFVFSHKDFWLQEQSLKFYQHRVADDSGIVIRGLEFRPRANGSALPYVQTFDLPDNRGFVHLIPGHPSVNGEANALFRDYQGQAARGEIQFRRWPLRAHKCRGQLLSNYFSQNTGAPYKYVGGAERTTPLDEGAQAVLGALALIKHRIATVLGMDVPFNEVLSAAYMEKQKMAFHSDSERGLGPVVASLSLGSAAEMHFRLHSKYAVTDGPRKVAMSILLRHGDVLVMEGAGVQEYYEHTVIPKNFRIVATARFISPENYTTGSQSRLSADS